MKPSEEFQVALWDAINRFADGSRLSVQRQVAVAEVNSLIADREKAARIEGMEAALARAKTVAGQRDSRDANAVAWAIIDLIAEERAR